MMVIGLATLLAFAAYRHTRTDSSIPPPPFGTATEIPSDAHAPASIVVTTPSAFSFRAPNTDPNTLIEKEIANSAAAEPPKTYLGPDGRPHAFDYSKPGQDLVEQARQMRRRQLMAELMANPAAFAAAHNLDQKQVRWIADGESDFSEDLLQ